jgi:O-antigen ligase
MTGEQAPSARDGAGLRTWPNARLNRGLLLQVVVCVVPAMLALRAGHAAVAAHWFFTTLLGFLGANLILGGAASSLSLIIAVLPGLMLLRNYFLYNSVGVLLGIGIGNLLLRSPADFRVVQRAGITWLLWLSTVYWLLSFMLTGEYHANLRTIEFVFAAGAIVLLSRHREQFASALHGQLVSLLSIGFAFFALGDRLGYGRIEGTLIGNPVTFGVPLALLLILANADDGRWLLLQRRPSIRLLISLVTGVLLLFSTSRVSWLVATLSLVIILLLDRSHRRLALVSVALLVGATAIAVRTERGAFVTAWYERTFSPKRTLLQKTSGRSDQWVLFPEVMKEAPIWGFGPGAGASIYARYSLLEPAIRFRRGQEMAWHSLYQQIAVETGIIGLAFLFIALALMVRSGHRTWRERGEVTPLLGALGFIIVAVTVSGLDAASGMFLGFGLLTRPSEGTPSYP